MTLEATSTRREFVQGALAALVVGGSGRWVARAAPPPLERYPPARYPRAGDPELQALATRALEAAQAAGASYADVRLTVTYTSLAYFTPLSGVDYLEHAALGVRAFVNGAWGFAGSTVWGRDEAARLGQAAAAAAALHAAGRQQKIDLGEPPPVVKGEWTTPIQVDPFTVSPVEQLAVLAGHWETIGRLFPHDKGVGGGVMVRHRRQEKTFASSTGSFLTQTLYTTHPSLILNAFPAEPLVRQTVNRLQPTAQGWEVMLDGTLDGELQRIAEEAMAQTDRRPVEPGRYDLVCDAYTVAHLLSRTVGLAAELDRALGYEAAASGTSYLAPPAAVLGTFNFGTPLLTVTANRSQPHGLATVQWDDEGVVPEAYPVVQDGVLVDYHTTRELVAPLAAAYTKAGRPLRSHGCAAVEHGGRVPLVQCPNLELRPAKTETSFEDLVAGLDKGLVICVGTADPPDVTQVPTTTSLVTTDSQQLNGELTPVFAYEVRKGKRTHGILGAEVLFRAPELWKSLQAIGGPASQRTAGCLVEKGQPAQGLGFSVTAVPARFQHLTVMA